MISEADLLMTDCMAASRGTRALRRSKTWEGVRVRVMRVMVRVRGVEGCERVGYGYGYGCEG